MKYLAFDIEIAFDFSRISTDLFPPNDGEKVLLNGEIINENSDDEEILFEAWYLAKTKEFRLGNDRIVPAAKTHWSYQGNNWKRFRPLGITCAAAASSDGGLWNWWAKDPIYSRFASKMCKDHCCRMVNELLDLVSDGYTILTWNGLGFDFDVISEESGFHEKCKTLALNHIDMMFHFHCSKGFPLGLDAAAKGMKLPGKPEGMTGAKASEMWPTDPHRVMAYCSLDVKQTLAVAQAVEAAGRLDWIARSGRPNSWFVNRWRTVKDAMTIPEPSTSWMKDPWPRSKFYGWTEWNPIQILTEMIEAIDKATDQPEQSKEAMAKRRATYAERLKKLK